MGYHRQALWEDDQKWKDVAGQGPGRWRVSKPGDEAGMKVVTADTAEEAARLYCRIRGLRSNEMNALEVTPENTS